MKKKVLAISVATIAAIAAWPWNVNAHDEQDSAARMVNKTPDRIERAPITPLLRKSLCAVHLEVDSGGAHMRSGQILGMVGPLPWFDAYLVYAVHPGTSGTPSLAWESSPHFAYDTGLVTSDGNPLYMIGKVGVREVSGEHPDWVDHPVTLEILKYKDDCPVEVDIRMTPHNGRQGLHGGTAHARN